MTEMQSSMIEQEQQFLLSRQARSSDSASSGRSQHRQHSEELYAFWAQLKSRLSAWNDTLHHLEEHRGGTGTIRQGMEDLKQGLQLLRRHCLASTVCFHDWDVPELPVADLRLLHAEFTKCSTTWETIKEHLIPKGKFVFRRYREEVGKRKAQGIPLDAPSRHRGPPPKSNKQVASTASLDFHQGPCIQDLMDASIAIDSSGNVFLEGERTTIAPVPGTALLIRNLANCSITIGKPLQALHVVQTTKTTIRVTTPIASAIHVTDCHDCSVHAESQQLRIHESKDLTFHVELVAGAILEDCTRIMFVSDSIDAKDFNWLRAGIPSPNFTIVPPANFEGDHDEPSPANFEGDHDEPSSTDCSILESLGTGANSMSIPKPDAQKTEVASGINSTSFQNENRSVMATEKSISSACAPEDNVAEDDDDDDEL